MTAFDDCWKRIERAAEHGRTFAAECERMLEPEAFSTSIEMYDGWTRGIARGVSTRVPQKDLALELGEFFYQLRAALDAAVYWIAINEGGVDPPVRENSIEFPICHKPQSFEKSVLKIIPFPSEILKWFECIQPYNGSKTAATTYSTLNATLKLLHDCARKDRHRRLHVIAAVPTGLQVEFAVSEGVVIHSVEPLRPNFLDNKGDFLAFGVTGVTSPSAASIKLKTALTLEFYIEGLPVPVGSNIGFELDRILYAARFVVSALEDGYNGVGFGYGDYT